MFSFPVYFCILLMLTAGGGRKFLAAGDNSQSTTIIIADITSTSISPSDDSSSSQVVSTISSPSTTESTTSPTTLKPNPAICRNLNVMADINIFKISGTWYEFARRGYGTYIQNVQCLQMDITYMNGTAMVNQTYAANMSSIHNQTSYEYTMQYNKTNISDYSILSTTYIYLPVPIFKILDTDYDTYLIACSYLPEWEQSAAAFAYFRDRSTPDNEVFLTVREAATKYADFDGMNLVYQGEGCKRNTVSRTLPTGVTIFTLLIFFALRLISVDLI